MNQALVIRNWIVGAYIVEYEQGGADRATYGARLLKRLAADLAGRGLKSLNMTLLKLCRLFYQTYPQIGPTLSDRFGTALSPIRIGPTPSDESSLGPIHVVGLLSVAGWVGSKCQGCGTAQR